jgi:cytochrome b involved in lipid metabolism
MLTILSSSGSGEPAEPKKFSVPEKEYTLEEVAKHNTKDNLWIAVKGVVLDLTNWVDEHPVS